MKRAKIGRLSAFSSLFLLVAGCATTEVQPVPQEMLEALNGITQSNGRQCLRVADISGYGTLNDSVLSVSSKFRKHYLLVTLFRCPEMEISSAALFKGSFTELCGGGRDAVFAGQRQCPVQGVYEFENRQAAFAAYDEAIARIQARREAGSD